MGFTWMFLIVYFLLSLFLAFVIYAACVVSARSPHAVRSRQRHVVSALDQWRKEQLSSFQVAVHPSLLLPRKGGN